MEGAQGISARANSNRGWSPTTREVTETRGHHGGGFSGRLRFGCSDWEFMLFLRSFLRDRRCMWAVPRRLIPLQ